MFIRVLPSSDPARLEFLRAASRAHGNDVSKGRTRLRPSTAERLQRLTDDFQAAHAAVNRQKEQLASASHMVNECTARLSDSLTDLWKSTRRRVKRGRLPVELLTHYGLPQQGRLPRPGKREEWLPLAVATVDGHRAAVAAGVPTRDISEVEQDLAEAQAAVEKLHAVEKALKHAEIRRRDLRPRVKSLARSLALELQSLLLDHPAATRRDIMRAYGIVWQSTHGEGGEPGATPGADPPGAAGAQGEVSPAA